MHRGDEQSGPQDALLDVVPVFQPIVDLRDNRVVAVEALARGRAEGGLVAPQAMFARAAAIGPAAVRELDERCLRAALAATRLVPQPLSLFVNVEPGTLAELSAACLTELAELVPPTVRVVVEVTERDLLERPGQLLAGVRRARDCGWGVALDDVGAEPAALALMPFLAPDVIKLDLALVRQQPSLGFAATINAVHAQAERTGALILAEGIETEGHLERALATSARLGQGWRFGRPAAEPAAADHPLPLPVGTHRLPTGTPFGLLSATSTAGVAGIPLLAAISRQLERQALLLDDLTVVLASFQHAAALTNGTRRRYEAVAHVTAFTALLGPGMPDEPMPGVRGTALSPGDPLAEEWVVAIVAPHYAASIAARELDPGPDGERRFAFVLTHDRARVLDAAALLLAKVRSSPAAVPKPVPSRPRTVPGAPARVPPQDLPGLLLRAIDTASNGIVIADARQRDLPLVYVNSAFLAMTGYVPEEVLGRNCRILQGPLTDRTQVRPIARQLAAGRPVRATLLNYRRDGSTFWNEITISPVRDPDGALTHFIGNQVDVSERVEREERAAYLAYHDPLTGLANRVQLLDHLEHELARARRRGDGVAVLFVDLDGFKQVNDSRGHAAGDRVLREAARRMRATLRAGDLLARISGDEFVAVLARLPLHDAAPARRAADQITSALDREIQLPGAGSVRIGAAAGIATFPDDGDTPSALLDAADRRMHEDED
ncbi:diguanylate cyclase domain-containing protein [Motilibacter aurantiacus]|uniref:diguanylate cyclase domain-containing protein n=1 Tax=Motilibacter aurantiacus TaxID=2714955 RepID=UPI00140DC385|nr:diguanylate cyclase [Motilibacter aurantiacus]NHC46759.1 diguanylate cyclase [Motilibacter aurantiacus]